MIQLTTEEKSFVRDELKPYLQKNDLKNVIRACTKAEADRVLGWLIENGVPILKVMNTIPSGFFTNMELTSVHIPSQIRKIENSAFEDSSLKQITFDEGVEEIGSKAFANTPCTRLALPNTVKKLAVEAFADSNLSEVFIPDSVTVLPIELFKYCKDSIVVYANSRKNMSQDKKLECPQSEIEWYKKHLKLNLNGQSLETEEGENNE